MEATKNSRYQVSSNSSPYSLAQHYNDFVQDVARTIPYNLLVNGQFTNLIDSNLMGWSVSGSATIGGYSEDLQRAVTLTAGSSIYQNIYNAYPTNVIQILPNKNYTIILYSNAPVSGFELETVASSANQIFNINDYTQTITLTDPISVPASGETYVKNILQFSTACTATLTGPIRLHIKNTSLTEQTILLGYCALYEGLVEYSYLSDRYLIDITLERGTVNKPSLNFIGDLSTGIYSPGINSLGITVNGNLLATATSAGNFLLNIDPSLDTEIDTLQVSGTSLFYGNIKTTEDIVALGDGFFTGAVTGNYANFSNNISGLNLLVTNSVTGSTANFGTSVTSPNFHGNADTATYSTYAGSATNAYFSSLSASGTFALNATNANYSTYSGSATNALTATNAINASNAVNATNATNAVNATNATNATNAIHANSSDTATYSTNSGSSIYATLSATADFAKVAANAIHASEANHSQTSNTATNSLLLGNHAANEYALLTQYANSLTKNGYQKLPGGLIIQWGETPDYHPEGIFTVTLPIPFPNAIFMVMGGSDWTYGHTLDSVSNSASRNGTSLSTILVTVDYGRPTSWIVFGY